MPVRGTGGAPMPFAGLRNASPRAAVLRGASLALALLPLFAVTARAHDVSYAHAEVRWFPARVEVALDEVRWFPARVEVALGVHQDDAAMALGVPVPEWFLEEHFLARAGPALADFLRRRFVRSEERRVGEE